MPRRVMPLPGVAGRPSRAPKAADSVEQRWDHFKVIFGGVRFCRLAWLVWLLVLARWCAPLPARGSSWHPSTAQTATPFGPDEALIGHQACLGHDGSGYTTWTCRTCDQTVHGPNAASTVEPPVRIELFWRPRGGVRKGQMPLAMLRRASRLMVASYRGPPTDAAVMWAATPLFEKRSSLGAGPTVAARHRGFEHLKPTRRASASCTGLVKSSRGISGLSTFGRRGWRPRRTLPSSPFSAATPPCLARCARTPARRGPEID